MKTKISSMDLITNLEWFKEDNDYMKYALLIWREQKWQLEKIYDEEGQAEKKINKSHSRAKVSPKIINIPNIKPGLKLYLNSDNSYYGTIIEETKSLYSIDNPEKPQRIPNPFGKETFIDKFFLTGIFAGIEEYDERFFGCKNEESFKDDDIDTYINEGNSKEEDK